MALILAIDTSAKPVSCALVQDDRLLGSFYSNTGLTHSQTLMPMIRNLLGISGITPDKLDAVAVNAGPGSFTGVRIGVSAVKGIAFTDNIPCISVSTLESMAHQVAVPSDTVICCTMDARCQQVYSALFTKNEAGETLRLSDDEAISLADLKEKLLSVQKPVVFVGDGSDLCYNAYRDTVPLLHLAPAAVRYQNAAATAAVAHRMFEAGQTISAEELLPVYLRLPQAERELNNRLNK